jgi:hypothetical protein
MEQRDSVGQPNPVEVTPSETAEFGAVRNMWLTPGSYLFREVASRPEILAIVERVEPERHYVIVALRSDQNDLLDRIFNAEREMFQVLRRVPFDLRVTVPDTEDTLQSILKSGIVHHLRR